MRALSGMIDLVKVIETYYKLVNLLDEELGISLNRSNPTAVCSDGQGSQ